MPADSEKDDNECRLLIVEDNRDIAAYIGSQFTDQYAIFLRFRRRGRIGKDIGPGARPDYYRPDDARAWMVWRCADRFAATKS